MSTFETYEAQDEIDRLAAELAAAKERIAELERQFNAQVELGPLCHRDGLGTFMLTWDSRKWVPLERADAAEKLVRQQQVEAADALRDRAVCDLSERLMAAEKRAEEAEVQADIARRTVESHRRGIDAAEARERALREALERIVRIERNRVIFDIGYIRTEIAGDTGDAIRAALSSARPVEDIQPTLDAIAKHGDHAPAQPEAGEVEACCDHAQRGGQHRFGCLRQQVTLPATRQESGTVVVDAGEVKPKGGGNP